MNCLLKYKKTKDKISYTSTSVSIRDDQAEFIRRNEINFSQLIRDYLDQLIQSTDPPTKSSGETSEDSDDGA